VLLFEYDHHGCVHELTGTVRRVINIVWHDPVALENSMKESGFAALLD
jgi:hypothetical protein